MPMTAIDLGGRSPALGSNEPTQAERGRENERLVDEAVQEAVHRLTWARRHAPAGQVVTTQVLAAVADLMQRTEVYVVGYLGCECWNPTEVRLWFATEGKRDAALDRVVANVNPGDRVVSYVLRLPKPLGELTDESVDLHVSDVGLDSSMVSDVLVNRHGVCPECGRSAHPPTPEAALDRIAAVMRDESLTSEQVDGAVVAVLRETGRLRDWHMDPGEPPDWLDDDRPDEPWPAWADRA
jgi:hypothetical protein